MIGQDPHVAVGFAAAKGAVASLFFGSFMDYLITIANGYLDILDTIAVPGANAGIKDLHLENHLVAKDHWFGYVRLRVTGENDGPPFLFITNPWA